MIEPDNQEAYKNKIELTQAMVNLELRKQDLVSSESYVKAYVWSFLIPPLGVYYFIKYLFFTERDSEAVKAGIISLALTLTSFFLSFWLLDVMFKQTTSALPKEDLQRLEDFKDPVKQKELLELLK